MFEREVGSESWPAGELPPEVRAEFARTAQRVTAFALTPWKEHCTECAMPACYATCDLYAPRRDGKCRRFVQGIETIPLPEHPQGYVAKVAFKRWGQLMAYANARLIPVDQASRIERRVHRLESLAAGWPGGSISVAGRRGLPSRMTGRGKQWMSTHVGAPIPEEPDRLLVEAFNPRPSVVGLSLSVSNPDRPPFEARLELQPGYQALEVPAASIRARVDLQGDLLIALDPCITQPEEEGLTLYFGLVGFVRGIDADGGDPAPVKVAVWDLDETIWTGTLVEDGLDGVHLREDAITVIEELDRRGILNSVLSKNDNRGGLAALEHFGIDEFFVFPQIGWQSKGAAMTGLVHDFDLDVTTFAFIDDQAFERAEVVAANPGVRAYDASAVLALLDLPEFNPPQSPESSGRRGYYRAQARRAEARESFGDDYLAFLRTCGVRVDITRPAAGSLDRIHELIQRTNQLNYSGVHRSRDEAAEIIENPAHECYVVSCFDDYGDYGTVGFLVVDTESSTLRDAMFSCRVRFKHVEHAALAFLIERARQRGAVHLDARFHETERNAEAASVFDDLGFQEVSREGPDRVYRFDLSDAAPGEDIVAVSYQGVPWEP